MGGCPTYFQRMTERCTPPQADRLSLIHGAFRLEWLTIAWMTVEAIVAVAAGMTAGSLVVLAFGQNVGLDVDRMKADMQDKAIEGVLDRNLRLAQALHITGTPGFVAGEQVTTGARDLSALQAFVSQARNGNQATK